MRDSDNAVTVIRAARSICLFTEKKFWIKEDSFILLVISSLKMTQNIAETFNV